MPAKIGAVSIPGLANLSKIPTVGSAMYMSINDANGSTCSGDNIWTNSRNYGNGVSAFPGIVASGADEAYMRFGSGVGGLTQGSGWVYITNATYGNFTSGPRFGNIKKFDFRGFCSPLTLTPANCDIGYFIGLCKNTGDASGLRAGLKTLNAGGAQTDAWRQNNVGMGYIGFYFRPALSANWQLVSGDGALNSTIVDSGIPAALSTQLLQFTYDGAIVKFYIGGVLVGAFGTTLPSNNMPMALFAGTAALTAIASTVQQVVNMSYACAEFQ